MANNFNLLENVDKISQRIDSLEEGLGKTLYQPHSSANSGPRKNLFSTQLDHAIPLTNPEPPMVQTGYENRYGDLSSSVIVAESQYIVEAIIPKFQGSERHHYFTILRDPKNKTFRIEERRIYQHHSESHGIIFNTSYMDSLGIGSIINEGDVIRKSSSYDKYNNRQDGVNLLTVKLASDRNMEDGMIISETAAEKLRGPYIDKVEIMINENDIPLNLLGTDEVYKSFPDIGEKINGGIVMALRRAMKERSLYAQSYNRLKNIIMSDEKFIADGIVIDIEIKCNNPDLLEGSEYNRQLDYYNKQSHQFHRSLFETMQTLMEQYNDYYIDYKLDKLLYDAEMIINGNQFIKDGKVFSNTIIVFTVLQHRKMRVGDKMSDRFGGKGVVSFILPDEEMISICGQYADAIINQSSTVGRLNPGRLMETSSNYVQSQLIDYIRTGFLEPEEAFDLITQYLDVVAPEEGQYFRKYLNNLIWDGVSYHMFLDSILDSGRIYTSSRPVTECLTINKIEELYNKFPWIKLSYMDVPIKDSAGKVRVVKSRRPVVVAYQYFYRLKQVAEEKMSATSLSSVNFKSQNSKSKLNKNHKTPRANTPIQFGDMETAQFQHVGIDHVVSLLMIHSVSPKARRLVESMLTGDAFNVDIKLDVESTNTNVTIVNAYLKAKGFRIVFRKRLKKVAPLFNVLSTRVNYYGQPTSDGYNKFKPLFRELAPGETYNVEAQAEYIRQQEEPSKYLFKQQLFKIAKKDKE